MSGWRNCQFLFWVHGVVRAENLGLTLAVVAEGHLGLAQTNGVLARSDAIELLEFSLVDALQMGRLVVSV